MARFHFSLDKVLELRIREEKLAILAVSKVEQELNDMHQTLNASQNELQEMRITFKNTTTLNIGQRLQFQEYFSYIMKQIANQEDKILTLNNVLGTKKKELLQAKQQKEIISKLKENRYEEWKALQKYKENLFLDEQGTLRHRFQQGLNNE